MKIYPKSFSAEMELCKIGPSLMASREALGIMLKSGVGENCGNLKFMAAASRKPSGQSRLSGVPRTEQILNISSISEFPGKSGLEAIQ
jgi:hypothetical protein